MDTSGEIFPTAYGTVLQHVYIFMSTSVHPYLFTARKFINLTGVINRRGASRIHIKGFHDGSEQQYRY
jgi:hypothetical protein